MNKKRCVVLVQLGTPDSLDQKDIKSYLTDFLMDPDTITLPYLIRYPLVNWIIVPKRTVKVIDRYRLIWDTERGSPLRYHSDELIRKLKDKGGAAMDIRLAMLYGQPVLEDVLEEAYRQGYEEILLIHLFPHDTAATTGVIKRRVTAFFRKKKMPPKIIWTPAFFNDPEYVGLMADRVRKAAPHRFDKIVFSFHGLPMKQNRYTDLSKGFSSYIEACEFTANAIADQSGLRVDQYCVSYQSRFGRNWTSPQTEDVLADLAQKGQSVLVVPPSFTADCLETSWEVGISFRETFSWRSPAHFEWIRSLNADDDWVNVIFGWIEGMSNVSDRF